MRREILAILPGLDAIFASYGKDCVITCGTEGHLPKDPHSEGFAIDIRTKHVPDEDHKFDILNGIKGFCGPLYYVELEALGQPNEHIHIQVKKSLWPTLL